MYNERLLPLANRISNWFCENYTTLLKKGLTEYRGWTEDVLNLRLEEDIFKLFTLAINWNTNISWEIGLATFEILDELDFLTAEKLRDSKFVATVKQRMKDWRFKNMLTQRIRQIQERPYAITRKTHSGPRSVWVDAYHVAAINWDLVREWLRVDEIIRGRTPRIEGKELIENLKNLFLIKLDGKTRSMLKVKTFLICRELNCQNVVNIDIKYCCVPDSRVREQMKILGFPVSYSYYHNSEVLARYFKKLYDLPIFYFFEECKKQRENNCATCRANEFCLETCQLSPLKQVKLPVKEQTEIKRRESPVDIIDKLKKIFGNDRE